MVSSSTDIPQFLMCVYVCVRMCVYVCVCVIEEVAEKNQSSKF